MIAEHGLNKDNNRHVWGGVSASVQHKALEGTKKC